MSAENDNGLTELEKLSLELNLTTLISQGRELFGWAESESPSYSEFLLRVLRAEAEARRVRRVERLLKAANLVEVEGLEDFDFKLRPRLSKRVVKELLECRWVEQGRNVLLLGKPGTGKTRVAKAFGRAACLAGHSVRYAVTAELIEELHASKADDSYRRVFNRYRKPSVVILDEWGYEPFDSEATKQLFRLISTRHRQRSLVLVSNVGFKRWKQFFPSEAEAVASVDRLIDEATILRFGGPSMRRPKDVHGEGLDDTE